MANSKNKVLLIEDDEVLIEMYKLKFKEEGIELLTALDGLTGLALAEKEKPAVILLDIMMPKMDGFAVLIDLKKDAQTKNIPILILTNLGQEADIEKGKKLGAKDYIVKSNLTPSQVIKKIKSYLK